MPDRKESEADHQTREEARAQSGEAAPALALSGGGEGASKLGRDDWVRAAYAMLAEGGAASLSVERLAARLGVTKGSFYWHFKDRADLLDALRRRWTQQLVITRVEAAGGAPEEKVAHLLDIVVRSTRQRRGGSLELAMRSWARRDAETARVVEAVDQERLDYTAGLFRQIGFDPEEAEARAFLLYAYVFSQGVFTFMEEKALLARIHALCRRRIAEPEDGARAAE
ncbi:MAG: TetR/AcrR family transcriptional regulator [Alphaproteobacteria bacterium]|nr:TetR/AcrR family transcriptional regulator [Alphaproteobacteria bacterium]